MFNPYNTKEIKDYAPTVTTYCGSTTSSATVLITESKDTIKNKESVCLNKKTIINKKIKLFDSFAGIGALHTALKKIGVNVELVGFSEIDKYATKSYCAIHNVNKDLNLGDVTKIDPVELPDFDLFNLSFPCQDISNAGKQKGMIDENGKATRSGLYKYGIDIIKIKKPKYIMIENVKNLVGKKFKKDFDSILEELNNIGYNTYYEVLNAKHYGIPQNRERVFVICIRKDIDNKGYEFPKGFESEIKLKDLLQDEVDEKFYLSEEYHERFIKSVHDKDIQNKIPHGEAYTVLGTTVDTRAKGTNSRHWVYDTNYNMSTLDATMYKQPKQILVPQATKKGYIECEVGGVCDLSYPNSKTRRGRVQDGGNTCPTLTATQQDIVKIEEDFRIRKLTPLECWRLMGFSDDAFYKAKNVGISDTQLYKQAGNSIVVDVLEYIFINLFKED